MSKNLKQLKHLSQVFLKPKWPCEVIAKRCQDMDVMHVVEIGPGPGNLTEVLLAHKIQVTAVERDTRFAKLLEEKYATHPGFRVIQGDFLQISEDTLFEGFEDKFGIVGNVPYHISTPLLERSFGFDRKFDLLSFLMQKEFVDRICADPGSKTYGSLSVFTQSFCKAENLSDVAKELFNPIPKVDSAILSLTNFEKSFGPKDQHQFEHMVKMIFSQRRKKIKHPLKQLVHEEHIQKLDLDLSIRAQHLSVDEFKKLFKEILELQGRIGLES